MIVVTIFVTYFNIIHGQDLRTANEKKNFPPHDEIFVILPPLLRVSPGGNSPTPRSKILSSTPGRIIFTPPIGSKISFYPPYLIKNFILPPLNCKFVVTPRIILPPPSGPTTCPCMASFFQKGICLFSVKLTDFIERLSDSKMNFPSMFLLLFLRNKFDLFGSVRIAYTCLPRFSNSFSVKLVVFS